MRTIWTKALFAQRMQELHPDIAYQWQEGPMKTKVACHCNLCGRYWNTQKWHLSTGVGCYCGGRNTTQDVREMLAKAYPNTTFEVLLTDGWPSHADMLCNTCGHGWQIGKASFRHVIVMENACRACFSKRVGKHLETPQEQFNIRMAALHPTIRFNFVSGPLRTRVPCLCLTCKNQWNPVKMDLLAGCGCPSCAHYGLDVTKAGVFYVIKMAIGHDTRIGFGVTTDWPIRYARHRSSLKKIGGYIIDSPMVWHGSNCSRLLAIETEVKEYTRTNGLICDLGIEGFRSEATYEDVLPKILKIANRFVVPK